MSQTLKIFSKLYNLLFTTNIDILRLILAVSNIFIGYWFLIGINTSLPYFESLFLVFSQNVFGFFLLLHGIVSIYYILTNKDHFLVLIIGRIFCSSFWSTFTFLIITNYSFHPGVIPNIMLSIISWLILVRTEHA